MAMAFADEREVILTGWALNHNVLYRIGTPAAMKRIVIALNNKDVGVRIAAARSCGLAKEKTSVDKLLHRVVNDEPPVQRQAATALGQIGDTRAVDQLLAASEKATDRFVEHAIIYSLFTLQSLMIGNCLC